MRTSIVPAQITTVEDKIAGNLTLQQLVLLTMPVFIGGLIYAFFPPSFGTTPTKDVIIIVISAVFGITAIRIKGKILLLWAIIILGYNLRPRYHLYNKNDMHLRQTTDSPSGMFEPEEVVETKTDVRHIPQLNTIDLVTLQGIVDNPKANFHIQTTRKGALSVRVTEIK